MNVVLFSRLFTRAEKNREPDAGDGAEDRVNNNEKRGRRRKRDDADDGLSNGEDDEAGDSGDEAKKKRPAEEGPLLRNHASISPSSPLFPYAATLANANITLDALQSTKMALAQMAANAMINKETQSPAALQEIAVLQSTLYALQQQQIMQLQLIQQLQQQLQISNLNEPPSAEVSAILTEANNVIQATRQSVTEEPELIESQPKRDADAKPEPKAEQKEPRPKTEADEARAVEKPSTSSTSSPSACTAAQPSDSWASNSYSSVSLMSQLASGSLADTILQSSEPPPNPEGPSTLDLLQRTAQQVLNNASQGLLATNLADELGFRNGSAATASGAAETGSGGKKDQLFKHRCRYCGKVFSSDSALQIHIRSHTGERPFKCNICGNRFTTKGNLKVHFQRHAQRFPHVKMNPHPVPEHLDKFHPPLLAQLEMDESKVSPPPPIPPFSNPHHSFHLPLPPPPPPPPRSPSSSMQIRPNQPSPLFRAAPFLLRPGNPLMQPRPAFQALALRADDKEPIKSEVKREEEEVEEPKVKTERPASVHEESSARTPVASENDHEQVKRPSADLDDSSSVDSKFNADYRSGDENIDESKSQKDLNSSVDLPENLCGRRSSSQSSADSSQPAPSDTSAISAAATPNLHFPPYNGAAVPPNLNALMLLPGEFDPAKDPAIYTNLLPRPGSNDNAWESLIEVTRTSDTAKLQQLVDNIENKLVDPNQCVVCHRVLSCKSALQMHYRTHTGERPFKCKICGRAFTTKGNLKTHMGVHRAKPPARLLHICPVCHKKFTNGLVLQQHIRLHTGEPTDLTPEQIAAAELRDPYGHPGFPFLPSGFHPFLAHPTSFMAQNPAANFQTMPDNLSLAGKGDNRETGDSRDGEDLMIDGGSSSEAHSPTSSTTSTLLYQHSALLNLQLQHQLQQRLRDNPQGMSEEERQQLVAHLSRANAEFLKKYHQELAMDDEDDAEDEDECDEDEPSDDNDKRKDSSKNEDRAPEMNGRSSPPTTKDNAHAVKSRSDKSPVSLSNRSAFSLNASPDIMPAFSASKPVVSPRQIASPLDLTANRSGNTISATFFPPPVSTPSFANFLAPVPAAAVSSSTASATPASTSSSSALSSLTSAVMASPSFNPLNLPISAPGKLQVRRYAISVGQTL